MVHHQINVYHAMEPFIFKLYLMNVNQLVLQNILFHKIFALP
jgi:hypothetical protein